MKLADLRYFRELGLNIVQPENTMGFSEQLNWEQAAKYPADLFISDDHQWSATGEELVALVRSSRSSPPPGPEPSPHGRPRTSPATAV
jgi:hypothetical protein